jgi:diguanylate cyclase (GGDEF)-like protein
MMTTWSDERVIEALDAEGVRLERVGDEAQRIADAIERIRAIRAIDDVRRASAEQASVIEQAALRDDVRTLAKAQETIRDLRATIERLQARVNELEAERNIDALTGALDRAGFAEALGREWSRAMRGRQPLGLVFVDVDRFKEVNDGYGHQAGDQVLRAIVNAIEEEAKRSGEIVARYGGDEFVVIVPQVDLPAALALGERIRASVAGLRVRVGDDMLSPTVSVGVAAMVPSFGVTSQELVARADRAAYKAKETGRGRTVAIEVEDGVDAFYAPDTGKSRTDGPQQAQQARSSPRTR